MAIFTVYLPPGDAPAPEKIVFLRDGFSFPAFFFGPLWLLWARAWIMAGAWTLLLAAIGGLGAVLKIPSETMSLAGLAAAMVLGFEGERLVAWSLNRRGYVETDLVIGDSVGEAEEVFFHRWRPRAREPLPTESQA